MTSSLLDTSLAPTSSMLCAVAADLAAGDRHMATLNASPYQIVQRRAVLLTNRLTARPASLPILFALDRLASPADILHLASLSTRDFADVALRLARWTNVDLDAGIFGWACTWQEHVRSRPTAWAS